jgi:anaerobic selenocysteine-containing dehydrogenase
MFCENQEKANMKQDENFVYTACNGTGCHEQCFLKTFVKDGKIVRTEQGVLGPPEGVRYGICQKGIENGKFPYLKSRLLHPLKRVGKRGEGRFEEISWNQAMNEIGAKLREIRDKYGPGSVAVNTFYCGYPANWAALHVNLTYRFIHTFGATCFEQEAVDSGSFFAAKVDFGSSMRYGRYDVRLIANARHILIWGSNPLGTTRATSTTRNILDAQEHGAKIVNIGLTYDSTAAKADQFIPVKGGTDVALALAMNRVLIEEGLCNYDYLTNYTVAPFLVRDDNGKFLREADIIAGGDPARYVYWNKEPAEARSIGANNLTFKDSAPDLLAQVSVKGIRCKTAFLKLRHHLAEWTPEHQETITGVPAGTVLQLAREYAANKPALTFLNYGMRYRNAREAHRAVQLLSALTGSKVALSQIGGGGHTVRLNTLPVTCPDGIDKVKGNRPTTYDFFESFRVPGEPKYRALLNVMGNPVHAQPGRKMWTDEVFPKLDLIIDYDIRMTDTALFADYVLPDTCTFERMELLPQAGWMILQEPAIKPIGEVKPPSDFWRELAKQVGLESYFNKTTEEWLEICLKSQDTAFTSVDPPVTLERLKKEKMVRLNVPTTPYDPFVELGFLTPTGRFEFYSEDFVASDEAMAKWVPPLIHTPKRKQFPLHLFVARHRMFMQTQFTDFPDLRELAGDKPWMRINPVDAAVRGIKDDDLVEVFNDRGKVHVKVLLSEAIPPGVAQMWFGYQADEYLEGAPTLLQMPSGTMETIDNTVRNWLEVVKKRSLPLPGQAPSMERWPETMNGDYKYVGGWDVIFDNYCEVRKISGGV